MLIPTILSIAFVYTVVSFINQRRKGKFCPICVAVSFTWLWLLILYMHGYHYDALLVGILMGGSVVGIMYQLKRTVWAHLYAALGFSTVYFLLQKNWLWFGVMLAIAVILGIWQRPRSPMGVYTGKKLPPELEKEIKEIEKKLEECCP